MVERLKCDDSACEHWPHPEGDLVRFEDYEALEVNALRELAAAQTAYVARGMELRDAQARLAEAEALWRNACERGDRLLGKLAEAEMLLREAGPFVPKDILERMRAFFTPADQP